MLFRILLREMRKGNRVFCEIPEGMYWFIHSVDDTGIILTEKRAIGDKIARDWRDYKFIPADEIVRFDDVDSLGEHLWKKFCDSGCDVVKFYWFLDLANRKVLYLNLDKLGRRR